MTVFENHYSSNPNPQVVATWGTPVPGIWARAEMPGELEPISGQVYETEFSLTSTPRDPTPREAYAILSEGVRRWRAEHPEAEIKYLEITRGSPQRLRMQYIAHSPFPLAAIAAAFIAVITIAASIAVPILKIALVVIAIWAALRIVDYFVPKPELKYHCPVCCNLFDTYAELEYHMRTKHPGVPIPPKEVVEKEISGLTEILRTVALVGIGLVGAYAFFKYILPTIRGRPGGGARTPRAT